jgi:hypothetical protein
MLRLILETKYRPIISHYKYDLEIFIFGLPLLFHAVIAYMRLLEISLRRFLKADGYNAGKEVLHFPFCDGARI